MTLRAVPSAWYKASLSNATHGLSRCLTLSYVRCLHLICWNMMTGFVYEPVSLPLMLYIDRAWKLLVRYTDYRMSPSGVYSQLNLPQPSCYWRDVSRFGPSLSPSSSSGAWEPRRNPLLLFVSGTTCEEIQSAVVWNIFCNLLGQHILPAHSTQWPLL